MKKLMGRVLLLVLFVAATGCGTTSSSRVYQKSEEALGTETDLLIQYHSVLYHPNEIGLNYPGFIVGIEKSPTGKIITDENDIQTIGIPGSNFSAEKIKRKLIERKVMYVSHVVESFGNGANKTSCALFNPYYHYIEDKTAAGETHPPLPLITSCNKDKEFRVKIDCAQSGKSCKSKGPIPAFKNSWQAMDILKARLKEKLNELKEGDKPFTHVVLMTMGWNTAQEEAVRNFNSLALNIKRASTEGEFNPLFVGVTWPSMWESSWVDPIVKLFSYGAKAPDADEVGLSWLGVLLHDTLKEVELPIVVLGHSFGARATSMGACAGPGISRDENQIENRKIDLLISLQGAYSLNRYIPDKGMNGQIDYPNRCSNTLSTVLVSSEHDTALKKAFHVPFAGEGRTYKKYCGEGRDLEKVGESVICREVTFRDDKPTVENIPGKIQPEQILFINANQIVNLNAYKSGGGAHSDIYRQEMGMVLWQLIDKYAKQKDL